MAQIIQFPRDHTRASERRDLSARSISKSAVTPAADAGSALRIGFHQSAGMLSRCHHLDTCSPVALMSSAQDFRVGHSSITERNERGLEGAFGMTPFLGQSVLKIKAKMSGDPAPDFRDNLSMSERMTETEEKAAFIARTRAARLARFPDQKPICTILGLEQGTYKQYETRTPLPHRHIPKFVAATGVSYEWLLEGEGEGPKVEAYIQHVPKRRAVTATPRKISRSRVG